MRTWCLVHVFLVVLGGAGRCEETTLLDSTDFPTTFLPIDSTLAKHEPIFNIKNEPTSTSYPFKIGNATLEDTQRKLQKIANITIAQFLNKQHTRNLSLSEILELRDMGNLILNPDFMLQTMLDKRNITKLSDIPPPSPTILNLGSAILKSDFMPTAFFKPPDPPKLNEAPDQEMDNLTMIITNATKELAFSTMVFHRQMMNEFLCRNYIAESILQMLEKDAAMFSDDSAFSSRQGEETPDMSDSVAEMITDLGSMRYKEWLTRSAVLTDVYRNMGGFEPVPYMVKYKQSEEIPEVSLEDRDSHNLSRSQEDDEDEDDDDDDDEKKTRKKPSKKKKKKKKKKPTPTPKPDEDEDDDTVEDEEEMDDDEDDNDGEAGTVLQVIDGHALGHGPPFEPVDNGWSIFKFGFVDFYDSALTAIAFLTFGIFTLQVFITLITNTNAPRMGILVNNSTVAPPVQKRSLDLHQVGVINATENLPTKLTETTAEAPVPKEMTADATENTTVKYHKEKEHLKEEMHNFTTHVMGLIDKTNGEHLKPTFELVQVDEVIPNIELYPDPEPSQQENPLNRKPHTGAEEVVAKFALVILRSVLKMDNPRCLHAALCRANRATLQLEGPPRLWLPLWSVGMSWLAQRAGGIPGSRELVTGALENLKASVLGLAGVKCEVVYPAC